MVKTINGYHLFQENIQNFENNEYITFEEPKIVFEEAVISFDENLVHYIVQPHNKINTVTVNREADLIFKKGDYLHTYITIDSIGLPDDIEFKLVDENGNQLYSPFTPDGDYQKWECVIRINKIDVIPLPADYSHFDTWIDFEPGFYNWRLESVELELYDNISIDLMVEIRDFEVWKPVQNFIYAHEPVIYQLRTYVDTIPESTSYLTEHADYNPETGCITFPPSDIDTSLGAHFKQVDNRLIYYEIKEDLSYLINLVLNDNADLEATTELESVVDENNIVDTIELEGNNIVIKRTDDEYAIMNLAISDGDLIFDIINLGEYNE